MTNNTIKALRLNKRLRVMGFDDAPFSHTPLSPVNIAGIVFSNIDKEDAAEILKRVTDIGKVPEPLRLAHFIGSAIKTGESSNRA